MKPTPEFWAAVRLVAFANMRPTQGDWLSLYGIDARDLGYTQASFERQLTEARQRASTIGLQFQLPIRPGPLPLTSGELWRQFVAGVREYGEPPTRAAVLGMGGYSPLEGWLPPERHDRLSIARLRRFSPAVQKRLAATWSRALQQLHRGTRRRLDMICASGADLTSLVRELERHHLLGQHLRAANPTNPRGPLAKGARFVLVRDDAPQTLGGQLDELFVRTAVGGWWNRIYRCEGCRRFRVDRLRRDSPSRQASRFCPKGDCRRNQWREERRAERLQLRSEILAHMEAVRKSGAVDPHEAARKQFDLSRRTFESLLRMRVKGQK